MAQEKLKQLEDRKIELEKEISLKENKMRELSREVSEIQVEILSLRGELKATIKIIEILKK